MTRHSPQDSVSTEILPGEGLWNGSLYRFKYLESTNSWSKDNLYRLNHGDVVQALYQTKGRGRQSRPWMSTPEGCLTLSLILENNGALEIEKAPMLGQAVAIAVRRLLRDHHIEASCKWPNDVMACGKKCAGILCESVLNSRRLIIGIGLNVNVSSADLNRLSPDRPASSMMSCGGKPFSLDEIRVELQRRCAESIVALTAKGGNWLVEAWNEADWLAGCTIELIETERTRRGQYDGLDSNGCLLLIDEQGNRNPFFAGDVKKVVNEK